MDIKNIPLDKFLNEAIKFLQENNELDILKKILKKYNKYLKHPITYLIAAHHSSIVPLPLTYIDDDRNLKKIGRNFHDHMYMIFDARFQNYNIGILFDAKITSLI